MRKIVLFIIILNYISICGQTETEDEIIIYLQAWSGNKVEMKAERLSNQPKWLYDIDLENYPLLSGNSYDEVFSDNSKYPQNIYVSKIVFDTEGDQNPDKTLALSTYKISNANIPNGRYFYVNTVSCSFKDQYFTYTVSNDKWYYGIVPPFNSSNEVSQGAMINVWETQETDCLELFLSKSIQNGHPYLVWNPYHNPSLVSSYKIYKNKNSPNYELLASTTGLDYLDTT